SSSPASGEPGAVHEGHAGPATIVSARDIAEAAEDVSQLDINERSSSACATPSEVKLGHGTGSNEG
ncbi:hypothetical protein QWZ14_29560, partial [Paeniroseomonas aquatica]